MLITSFFKFQLEGHQKPGNEAEFLNLAEHLVELEPGAFHSSAMP